MKVGFFDAKYLKVVLLMVHSTRWVIWMVYIQFSLENMPGCCITFVGRLVILLEALTQVGVHPHQEEHAPRAP
jgi:hypothetical protein